MTYDVRLRLDIIVPIIIVVIGISILVLLYPVNLEQQDSNFVDYKSNATNVTILEPRVQNPLSKYVDQNGIKKISSQEELNDIFTTYKILDEIYNITTNKFQHNEFGNVITISPELLKSNMRESFIDNNMKLSDANYSTTNTQVKYDDEYDYIKNDEKYVYILSGNTLSIIDTHPAEHAELILKISINVGSRDIRNMFLNGDRLIIFYEGSIKDLQIPLRGFTPQYFYKSATHVLILDISDKKNPLKLKDYSIDGKFKDARMIGDHVYFVTNKKINNDHPVFPEIIEDSDKITVPDAYHFDNLEKSSSFNTLTVINIFDHTLNSKTYLMGDGGTFYLSEDNFYLTYVANTPFWTHKKQMWDRFFDTFIPLLPKNTQEEISRIQNDHIIGDLPKLAKISIIMQESYNMMDKNDKIKLFQKTEDYLRKYVAETYTNMEKTIIHKISINGDLIEYVTMGSVPGTLLNQFSMDQNGDKLRIVTTIDAPLGVWYEYPTSAVYILDEKLEIMGELNNIDIDEGIISAKFVDDRLYLITFRQIDSFFVIDLSDDTPKILGELDIPGFSNYLRPYDEEHIIGIGRNVVGVIPQTGIKIALFDVSNVSNPIVVDDVIIGDKSTHSEILNDHKAFFFDDRRKILSIPISGDVNKLNELSNSRSSYNFWNGFYVFYLDIIDGFDLKGTIAHIDGRISFKSDHMRTFYINDALYTVTDSYLMINSIDNLSHINTVNLIKTEKIVKHVE